MPWLLSSATQGSSASKVLADYLLLPLSGFVALATFGGVCKSPETVGNLPLSILHGLAFLWTKSPATHRRASFVTLVAWLWRILVRRCGTAGFAGVRGGEIRSRQARIFLGTCQHIDNYGMP
jgi:hypothetical protein